MTLAIPERPESVLIIRLSALGDVAMTIPVVYDTCRAYPDTRFIFLTKTLPAKLFVNAPSNLTLHPVDIDKYKGVLGLIRIANELKKEYGITRVADLHNVLRSNVIRMVLRLRGVCSASVDKSRGARKRLVRFQNKVKKPLTPMHLRYRDVFKKLGFDSSHRFSTIYDNGAPRIPHGILKGEGEKWVGIAPFAFHKGKIYPPHLMDEVLGMLLKDHAVRLFVFGAGRKESAVIDEWVKKYGSAVINMAKISLGLEKEMSLMHDCAVMLSMDSANMHMASLAGTPVVSVWGATHPYCGFMGIGQKELDAVQLDMDCRPCSIFGNKPCRWGNYRCMTELKPEKIVQTVQKYLD